MNDKPSSTPIFIRMMNGPLAGLELPVMHGGPYLDFLDAKSGKIRRYFRPAHATFVKEWENREDYDREIGVLLEKVE